MTDLPARLVRLAQQLEDQHAPQHMTILMREAAKEMEQNLGQVAKLFEEITRLRAALRVAAHELELLYFFAISNGIAEAGIPPHVEARAALEGK